jgi:hypothetical protein
VTSGRDPWADPSTRTEPGPPYAGPPVTGPPAPPAYPPYGFGPYAPAPYGYPGPYGYAPAPYGHPGPWAPGPPPGPRRPGQLIASTVLAFVQAALVAISSLYLWFAASLVEFAAGQAPVDLTARDLASEGTALAGIGIGSAVLLVVGGVAGLTRRSRTAWLLLAGAHVVQVLLAAYWAIRLHTLLSDAPGTGGEAVFTTFALVFTAAPLVGLGLVLLGPGRRWFDGAAST